MQLKAPTGERIEHAIQLDFPASNNETKYEAILVIINLTNFVSLEKIIIRSDSQLVIRLVNEEYETRDQCMIKYVCLVKLQLSCFATWKLEHIPRDSNEKADALAAVTASLQIKETVFLPIYYQPASSITINQINEIDETSSSWMTLIVHYLSLGELPGNGT